MNTSHAPAPWRAFGTAVFGDKPEVGQPAKIARTLTGHNTHEEAYANARLIAAAPELLEALKACQDEADHILGTDCEENNTVGKTNALYIKTIARQAIAKATGGAS